MKIAPRPVQKLYGGSKKETGQTTPASQADNIFSALVAQTVVHSTIAISRQRRRGWDIRPQCAHARRCGWRTIYGGGPTECPFAYETIRRSKKLRSAHRGATVPNPPPHAQEIARARAKPRPQIRLSEPLVASAQ